MPITLRGTSNVALLGFLNKLKENLIEYFRWGLAQAGNYQDVSIVSLGNNTGTPDCLTPYTFPSQTDQSTATVWQSLHSEWAYETGLVTVRQPIVITQIFVNGTGVANDGSQYSINYWDGRVVFNTPIPVTSIVQVSYSYRYYNIYDQTEPWFNQVVYNQFITDQTNAPPGALALMQSNRVQLPLILIEDVPNYKFVPKQLGDISQFAYQDFILHVMAEDAIDRSNLVSIITGQKETVITGFDPNVRAAAKDFEIDYLGRKVSGKSNYESLVANYPWQQIQFYDIQNSAVDARLPFYRATCKVTLLAWYEPEFP